MGDYGFVKAIGTDGMKLGHHGGGIVRVRTDGTGLEMYATGTRNVYDVGIDPFMRVFARASALQKLPNQFIGTREIAIIKHTHFAPVGGQVADAA